MREKERFISSRVIFNSHLKLLLKLGRYMLECLKIKVFDEMTIFAVSCIFVFHGKTDVFSGVL